MSELWRLTTLYFHNDSHFGIEGQLSLIGGTVMPKVDPRNSGPDLSKRDQSGPLLV